jgi:hypothetical protein
MLTGKREKVRHWRGYKDNTVAGPSVQSDPQRWVIIFLASGQQSDLPNPSARVPALLVDRISMPRRFCLPTFSHVSRSRLNAGT